MLDAQTKLNAQLQGHSLYKVFFVRQVVKSLSGSLVVKLTLIVCSGMQDQLPIGELQARTWLLSGHAHLRSDATGSICCSIEGNAASPRA